MINPSREIIGGFVGDDQALDKCWKKVWLLGNAPMPLNRGAFPIQAILALTSFGIKD